MILEFYGLPGTGKPTLTKALIESDETLFRPKIRGRNLRRTVFYKSCFSLKTYTLAALLLKIHWKKKSKADDFRHIKIILRMFMIYAEEAKLHSEEIYCFDNGLIQSLLSFTWEEPEMDADILKVVGFFEQALPESLLFVYAENDNPDEIVRRMVQRGEDRRILHYEASRRRKLLALQKHYFDAIHASLSESNSLKISTNDPNAVSVSAIREWVDRRNSLKNGRNQSERC